MNIWQMILPLAGGLGLFLYGMHVMSNALERSAGDKLEKLIERLSGNIFWGILVGTVVTATVQSSSATTVMVVGFVNAGIMTLKQSIGIIMGANIGTTITAQMLTVDVGAIAPLGIAVGVLMKLFSKNHRVSLYGEIILGVAILFFGMEHMKDALSPLKNYEGFTTLIASIGKGDLMSSIMGFGIGVVVTAVIQSSSATTGIMVALASTGTLPIQAAFPILMGTNVGTCVTALLSSVGANKTAKRAALMHLLFNVIGTVIFMVLFSKMALWIVSELSSEPDKQLANVHTLFNVLNTLILIPFAGLIVTASTRLIPITESEKEDKHYSFLDERLLATPHIAMGQAVKEVNQMAELIQKSLRHSINALVKNKRASADKTFRYEKRINKMEHDISDYLIQLSNTNLDAADRVKIDIMFNTINDLERVGDHADNLAELSLYKIENKVFFSESSRDDIQKMTSRVFESYRLCVEAMLNTDKSLASEVIAIEGEVDELEKHLRRKHIARLNDGKCGTREGIIFLDTLSNLERVSDHASNVAMVVIEDV